MRLDSQGLPHVAYVRDHVYYAYYDGTDWHTEIVADPPSPIRESYLAPAAIALDATDTPPSPTSTLRTPRSYTLIRQRPDGMCRTVDTARPGEDIVFKTTLALDRQNRPHLIYSNYGKLKYAQLGPGAAGKSR